MPHPYRECLGYFIRMSNSFWEPDRKTDLLQFSLKYQCKNSCGDLTVKKLFRHIFVVEFGLIYKTVLELNALMKGP